MNKKQLIVVLVVGLFIFCGCAKTSNPKSIESIAGRWHPYGTFYPYSGDMIINDESITWVGGVKWASGQKIIFRIIRQNDKEILIEITDKILLQFYGRTYKFIRFIIKKTDQIEARLYKSAGELDDEHATRIKYIRPESLSDEYSRRF